MPTWDRDSVGVPTMGQAWWGCAPYLRFQTLRQAPGHSWMGVHMSLPSQFSSVDIEIAAQPKTLGWRAQGLDRAARSGREDRRTGQTCHVGTAGRPLSMLKNPDTAARTQSWSLSEGRAAGPDLMSHRGPGQAIIWA